MTDPPSLAVLKADLTSLPAAEVFKKYVLREECVGLVDVDHTKLRRRIAEKFGIGIGDIVIVGSAKLGYTLRDKKQTDRRHERPAFSPFSDDSDVDIAIISDRLFDQIWKRCFEFWDSSGYASGSGYWPSGGQFRDYVFRGWMRPDHLPSEGSFSYRAEWFDFFRRLTSDRAAGDYKITAGLYREIYFLRAYQLISINQCRISLGATP